MSENLTIDKNLIYEDLSNQPIVHGVVTISHGMAEHIERYSWLINKLNQAGYHVISIDHLGHGRHIEKGDDQGFFSDLDGFECVENNLINILSYADNKFPNLKKILIGHSMGSWISLGIIQKYFKLDAMVLTGSSLIPNSVLKSQKKLVSMLIMLFGKKSYSKLIDNITMRKYNLNFSPNRTPNDWLSRDKISVDEYTNDPKCGFLVTNSLWYQLSDQMMKVFNHLNYSKVNNELPIYLISGDRDPVGDNGNGVESLHKFLLDIFPKTYLNLVKDARHEVFNEINKDESFKDMLSFFDSHIK